jgi:aminopeptidase N
MNRAQMIDDSFHLSRADLLTFDVVMGMMNYLEHETDYLPWVAANRANTLLSRWLSGTEVFPHYQMFMRKNVETLFLRLGVDVIENEPRVDRYARTIAMNIACSMKHEACLELASARLRDSLIEYLPSNPLKPDIAIPIYCNGIRKADFFTFDRTLSKAMKMQSGNDKNIILNGLGCTHDTELLTSYFDFAISTTSVLTLNERNRILVSATNNGESSVRAMIKYIETNYQRIASLGLLNSMCTSIASRIFNKEMHDEFGVQLDKFVSLGLLTANQRNTHGANSGTILAWQEKYLENFVKFFQ